MPRRRAFKRRWMSRLRRKPLLLPCLSSLKSLSSNPQFGSTDYCNIFQQQGGFPKEAHAREFFDILNRTVAGRASSSMPLSTSAPGFNLAPRRKRLPGGFVRPRVSPGLLPRSLPGPKKAPRFTLITLIHLDQAGPCRGHLSSTVHSPLSKSAPFYFDCVDSP
jgi:hypothetical protein